MASNKAPASKTTSRKKVQKKSPEQIREEKQASALSQKVKKIEVIIKMIEEEAISLRKSLKINKMSSQTFYEVLDNDANLAKRYVRACDARADAVFDEILDIADDNRGDTIKIKDKNGVEIEIEDKEWTSRSKLRVDARKWYLSKMRPEKYGDKLEIDQKSEVTVSFKGGE